jgi:hypothetical protein
VEKVYDFSPSEIKKLKAFSEISAPHITEFDIPRSVVYQTVGA